MLSSAGRRGSFDTSSALNASASASEIRQTSMGQAPEGMHLIQLILRRQLEKHVTVFCFSIQAILPLNCSSVQTKEYRSKTFGFVCSTRTIRDGPDALLADQVGELLYRRLSKPVTKRGFEESSMACELALQCVMLKHLRMHDDILCVADQLKDHLHDGMLSALF